MTAATSAIANTLLSARIIASDETTTRTNGITQWQWVFISDKAVLHKIAPRRARSVAEEVLGSHQPDVWVSDRYAGQQGLGKVHQVCLAMSCATFNMRSSAATQSSLRKSAIIYDGRSGSENDDTSSSLRPWQPMPPKPTTSSPN